MYVSDDVPNTAERDICTRCGKSSRALAACFFQNTLDII